MGPSTPLPLGADGIQLINKDDGWSFLLGKSKGVPDQLGAIPDEHLHQLRASQLQEGGLGGVGMGLMPSGQKHHDRPPRALVLSLPISLPPPKALTLVCAAQARASSVFPVPGGPYISTPFGGWIPKFSNFSLWFIGRTMASTSCQEEVLGEEREALRAPIAQP